MAQTQDATSDPLRLIPQPSAGPFTYGSLGLDRKMWRTTMAGLRTLALDMLDMSLPQEDQDPLTWTLFVHQAIEKYPVFCRYEGAWPVTVYIKRHLYNLSWRKRHTRKNNDRIETAGSASLKLRIPPRLLPSGDPGSCTTQSPQESESVITSDSSSASTSIVPPSVSTPPASSSPQASSLRDTEELALLPLLCAWDPPLDHLAQLLSNSGVFHVSDLRQMQGWPVEDRKLFLRDDAKMTAFQVMQLELALRKF